MTPTNVFPVSCSLRPVPLLLSITRARYMIRWDSAIAPPRASFFPHPLPRRRIHVEPFLGSLSREKQPGRAVDDKPIGWQLQALLHHCIYYHLTLDLSPDRICARARAPMHGHAILSIILSYTACPISYIRPHEALETRTTRLGKYAHTYEHLPTYTCIAHAPQTSTREHTLAMGHTCTDRQADN